MKTLSMIDPRKFLLPAMLAGLLPAGCVSIHESDHVSGPDYEPRNVYQTVLPAGLTRVAVLPVTTARDDRNHRDGATTLGPLLQRGLVAVQAFEVAPVAPDWLRRHTGQRTWRVDEPLPPELLTRVLQAYGCDAVLFPHLSEYHPYPPLRIGWRLKLVAGPDAEVVWSVDELFDASRPEVVNSARRFYQGHQWGVRANGHSRAILDSPRRFGAYSISELLRTFAPKNIAKVTTVEADR
jgi:hypothetical protein